MLYVVVHDVVQTVTVVVSVNTLVVQVVVVKYSVTLLVVQDVVQVVVVE